MIAVVGDTLLDVDVTGTATRLSPDAPVPVLDVTGRKTRAGGAGLVAAMLALDGEDVVLVTALADDDGAAQVREALGWIPVVAGRLSSGTPTKTRMRAAGHPLIRVDEACGESAAPEVTAEMLDVIARADVVVVADYGRGLAADPAVRHAIAERSESVPVVWDPHPRGAVPVAGCRVVTPNEAEARGFHPEAVSRPELLREMWGVGAVAVTRGSQGATLARDAQGGVHVPVTAVDVADPCGAGDRLASALAVGLGHGLDLVAALERAVESAAAFLAEGGVSTLGLERLRDVPRASSGPVSSAPVALPRLDALAVAERVRANGGTVVATGGCFDLLHAGHARTLAAARELGDCLIVCLNSDESVTRLKGPDRPIMNQDDRVDLLSALECVDAVVVFGEDTPHEVLSRVRPDIWVKGGDYDAETLPEASLVATWGGRTLTVPFHPGRSTTRFASALAKVG